jgi:hypothetical protein
VLRKRFVIAGELLLRFHELDQFFNFHV